MLDLGACLWAVLRLVLRLVWDLHLEWDRLWVPLVCNAIRWKVRIYARR